MEQQQEPHLKPSRKTVIAFDKAYRRFLNGDIERQAFLRICVSLWELYHDEELFTLRNELLKMRNRKYRWKKYLRGMVPPLYLVTLTFSDEEIAHKSRRKFVTQALEYFDDYFCCVDYGKKNGREHYHAIVSLCMNPYTKYAYPVFYSKKKKRVSFDFNGFTWRGGWYSAFLITDCDYKVFSYAFKSANYAFKQADEHPDIRPFHKRGSKPITLESDYFLWNI